MSDAGSDPTAPQGELVGPSVSVSEYVSSEFSGVSESPLRSKVLALAAGPWDYLSVRKIRGDGSCFYRAFLYRIAECCVLSARPSDALSFLNDTCARLEAFSSECPKSLDSDMLDIYFDETVDFLKKCAEEIQSSTPAPALSALLDSFFSDPNTGDTITYTLRLVAALQLISKVDDVANYLPESYTSAGAPKAQVRAFADAEVLPATSYADHLVINAIVQAFRVEVTIMSVDAAEDAPTRLVISPEGGVHPAAEAAGLAVHLLFRPGHYDVLYPKESA